MSLDVKNNARTSKKAKVNMTAYPQPSCAIPVDVFCG
jgi:hypothetical protein